jgi:hypothetical protein
MCATVSWGAHESFMHPIFVLKNGCDKGTTVDLLRAKQLESVMERNCHSGDRGDSLRMMVRRRNRFKIYSIIMMPQIPKNCYKRIKSKTD